MKTFQNKAVRQFLLRLFLITLVLPFLSVSFAEAAQMRTGQQPSTAKTENIAEDVYMAGGSVISSANIFGDLVIAGGTLAVNGPVEQDLLAAGGTVIILGDVQDDLRVAGGNVTIGGSVGGDVVAGGGNIQMIGKNIGGDVIAGGGTVNLDAPVGKNARLGGGQITINSTIAGNVEVDAQNLTLGSSAVIEGNLNYRGAKEMKTETGAVVKGKTTYSPLPQMDKTKIRNAATAFFSFLLLMKFLGTLICALVFALLFRRYSTTLVTTAQTRLWSHLSRGLVALIVWPVIAVALMITVVGLPLGIIALLGYIAAMIFTSIVAPIVLGSLLYAWMMKSKVMEVSWKSVLLGVVAYFLIGIIPVLGWIFCFAIFLITLGAILDMKKSLLKEWR